MLKVVNYIFYLRVIKKQINIYYFNFQLFKGLMAEWSKRGTVNTFYRGSNPLKALN